MFSESPTASFTLPMLMPMLAWVVSTVLSVSVIQYPLSSVESSQTKNFQWLPAHARKTCFFSLAALMNALAKVFLAGMTKACRQ